MVMNINPVDGNIVGWGNDFWAGKAEYGGFEHRFAKDYKSPAAYTLKGDELMIQSVAYPDQEDDAAFATTEVRGWRQWPLNRPQTFGSLFHNGGCTDDRCGGENHPCKTGQPSAVELGTTDEWDDIIRVQDCVRTDVRSGWTSGGEGFRLMVRPDPTSLSLCSHILSVPNGTLFHHQADNSRLQ